MVDALGTADFVTTPVITLDLRRVDVHGVRRSYEAVKMNPRVKPLVA